MLMTTLVLIWAAVTVAFVAVMIWKSLVGLREEDVVILDPVEDRQAAEQRETVAKVERLTSWAKGFGIASAGLLVLTGVLWLYQGLKSYTGTP